MPSLDLTKIGGSDVAAIVGVSPYKTAADIYYRILYGIDQEPGEAAMWGKALEAAVGLRFSVEHQTALCAPDSVVAPLGLDWARASVDYRIPAWPQAFLEVKTASERQRGEAWGTPGTDQIPQQYLCQVQWYCQLLGYEVAHIAVLFGGNSYAEYVVQRDGELGDMLVDAAHRFYRDHIKTETPPPDCELPKERVNWAGVSTLITDRVRHCEGHESIRLGQLMEVRRQKRDIEHTEGTVAAEIKDAIGFDAGLSNDEVVATWKFEGGGNVVDWKAVAQELAAVVGSEAASAAMQRHSKQEPARRVFRVREK